MGDGGSDHRRESFWSLGHHWITAIAALIVALVGVAAFLRPPGIPQPAGPSPDGGSVTASPSDGVEPGEAVEELPASPTTAQGSCAHHSTGPPIAKISSDWQPMRGETERSSGNFSLSALPPETTQLCWEIQDPSSESIRFDVQRDRALQPDPTVYIGVVDGSLTPATPSPDVYIANPTTAEARGFTVTVYAVAAS
jgi:hypothetical protein